MFYTINLYPLLVFMLTIVLSNYQKCLVPLTYCSDVLLPCCFIASFFILVSSLQVLFFSVSYRHFFRVFIFYVFFTDVIDCLLYMYTLSLLLYIDHVCWSYFWLCHNLLVVVKLTVFLTVIVKHLGAFLQWIRRYINVFYCYFLLSLLLLM